MNVRKIFLTELLHVVFFVILYLNCNHNYVSKELSIFFITLCNFGISLRPWVFWFSVTYFFETSTQDLVYMLRLLSPPGVAYRLA